MSAESTVPVPGPSETTPERVSYSKIHGLLRRRRGRAADHPCAVCGQPARQWAWNHTGQVLIGFHVGVWLEYTDDLEAYDPLCVEHHIERDLAYRRARRQSGSDVRLNRNRSQVDET